MPRSTLTVLLPIYFVLLMWNISWSTSVSGPVMPLYVRALGMDVIGWSMLAMSGSAGMFIFEWIWGTISDKVGRETLLIVSMCCMSLLFSLYTVKSLVPFFFVFQFLSGAMAVVVGPVTRAMVFDGSRDESIGFSASLWWTFHALGRMIGPLMGGYIAHTASFECSFFASSFLSALLVLVVLIVLRARKQRKSLSSPKSITKGLTLLASTKSVRFILLAAIPVFAGIMVIRSFLPLYASEQVGMSTMEVGILMATISGAQLVAMPVLGWLSDRTEKKHVLVGGLGISGLLFLLHMLVRSSFQLLLASVMVSISLSVHSLLLALLSENAPRALRGTAMGVYGSFEDLGMILGPLVYGAVWSIYSPASIFMAASVLQILSILPVLAIRERPPKEAIA